MSDQPDHEVLVFNAALQLPAAGRSQYLDEVCQGNHMLRQRLEGLLNAYQRAGSFLEEPAQEAPLPRPTIPGDPQAFRVRNLAKELGATNFCSK